MADEQAMHVGEYREGGPEEVAPAQGFACGVAACQGGTGQEDINDEQRLNRINQLADPGQTQDPSEGQQWEWGHDGTLRLTAQQPKVYVPLIQEVQRRDLIVEVPKVEVVDAVKAQVYGQDVKHDVPVIDIETSDHEVVLPHITYVEKEVVVPIVTGYTHKFVPKWEIREVPRPVIKYVGEQRIIEVDVPQVKFVDKIVEKELVVDTVEKRVPKIIEQEKEVETVKYVWKPIEKIIHVDRYVPRYDVSLECPAPLIVPYTVPRVKQLPSSYVRQNDAAHVNVRGFQSDAARALEKLSSPPNTVPIKEDYVREYSRLVKIADDKMARKQQGTASSFGCMNPCSQDMDDDKAQNDDQMERVMQNVPPAPVPEYGGMGARGGSGHFLSQLQANLSAAEANQEGGQWRMPEGMDPQNYPQHLGGQYVQQGYEGQQGYQTQQGQQGYQTQQGQQAYQTEQGQQGYQAQQGYQTQQSYNTQAGQYSPGGLYNVPPSPSSPDSHRQSQSPGSQPDVNGAPQQQSSLMGRVFGGMFNRGG